MKFILFTLLAQFAVAAPMEHDDSKFGCISQDKANRYIRDYNIDTRSFGGIELCNSDIDTKKLFNDLQILEDGRFSNSGNNNLIKGIIPADQYYSWMRSQTRGVERGNDIPTATAYNSMGYFTMQDGWAALSTLGRVGTIVHEARHTAGYRHYPCRQGSYEGSNLSGCDQSYSQAGSHAVEMEYYARVSVQGTNFHPVYKSMARLMAVARANFVFNTPVLRKREALVAVNSNAAYLYENGQWIQRELPSLSGQPTLKRTSAGAVLFGGDKAYSIEMYENTGSSPLIRDDYSYFKMLSRKETWKDLEEFDLGTRRFLVGITPDNKVSSFVFAQGSWSPLRGAGFEISKTATTLENGEQGFFLVGRNGDIYPFDPLTQRLGSAKNFKWSSTIVSAAKMGPQTLGLMTNGEVFENQNNQWVPWAPAQGMQFTGMVNVPLYDAFEVVK